MKTPIWKARLLTLLCKMVKLQFCLKRTIQSRWIYWLFMMVQTWWDIQPTALGKGLAVIRIRRNFEQRSIQRSNQDTRRLPFSPDYRLVCANWWHFSGPRSSISKPLTGWTWCRLFWIHLLVWLILPTEICSHSLAIWWVQTAFQNTHVSYRLGKSQHRKDVLLGSKHNLAGLGPVFLTSCHYRITHLSKINNTHGSHWLEYHLR